MLINVRNIITAKIIIAQILKFLKNNFFLELDFIISPHGDLQEYLIIEMKQASKIDDSNRHQLKSQLRSAPLNNHEIINKVTKGILLNFKKVEKYKEGTNVIPEEKIDLEVWSYKDNKLIFEKI